MRVFDGTEWADSVVAAPVSNTPQTFSGDGVTTTFALSSAPPFESACDVAVGGVVQTVGIDFGISGTTDPQQDDGGGIPHRRWRR